MVHTVNNVRTARPSSSSSHALDCVTLAVLCCTMLSSAAFSATAAYPGASTSGGTVLNGGDGTATQITEPNIDANAASPEAQPQPSATGLFGNLFSSDENTTSTVETPVHTISDAATSDASTLGEPDSSPALFAARTELDVAAPKAEALPQDTANAKSAAGTGTHSPLGEPDNSPALFESRRELEPVQNGSKIASVLTSMLTPITGEDTQQHNDDATGTPVAAYESPGIVVKKQSFKQAAYQPELHEREIQVASLNPASGTASDSGPLIQLPEPVPENTPVPASPMPTSTQVSIPEHESTSPATPEAKRAESEPSATQPEPTPVAPVVEQASEPRRELSPASKAILRKIPSNLDANIQKKMDPISLDRAKDTKSVEGMVSAESSVKHEEMGIKIEVKSPTIDLGYELEKAYNATIAGQTSTAIDIYKNILQNDPNNRSALFALGTLYHRAGQLDAARKLYAKLLSLDPNNRDALNNFLVLMSDEAPEAALEQLTKLEKRDPKFSPIPAQMAIIYQKMGDLDKASEKMFRAVDLSPENLLYRYNLAIMLDKQQKYDEAGKLYHQILDAYHRGETVPGNIQQIQQRLIFISSNKH